MQPATKNHVNYVPRNRATTHQKTPDLDPTRHKIRNVLADDDATSKHTMDPNLDFAAKTLQLGDIR